MLDDSETDPRGEEGAGKPDARFSFLLSSTLSLSLGRTCPINEHEQMALAMQNMRRKAKRRMGSMVFLLFPIFL